MAIAYPLAFPTVKSPRSISIRLTDVVGLQASPISLEQTLYDWGGDMLAADVELPPMVREDAEPFVAFLWALRGMVGTFLMGDPAGATPRGTWAGSPVLVGAHAAGVRTLSVDGFSAAATGKAGDWIQFGSGSSTRLHKVLEDFTADGAGLATIEIGPRTRAALADNEPLDSAGCLGRWRLASNTREFSIGEAVKYGLRFSCVEALDG
jgi:hypothetical protein